MALRLLPLVLLAACATSGLDRDGRRDVALNDELLASVGDCEARETLAFVNDSATTVDVLKDQGVRSRAAGNIAKAHAGVDAVLGTVDDVLFDTLFDVDAVSYVGPAAMGQLLAIGDQRCAGMSDVVAYTCPTDELLAFVNAPSTGVDALRAIDLHSRAAGEIVAHRDGPDGVPGTGDDALFASVDELDAVPQVGPVAMGTMEAWGEAQCGTAETVFSPQAYHESHLVRVVDLIDDTQTSIDIAMYSFRDSSILDALDRAVDRGVSVRFLFEGASDDRRDPAGTRSAALEDIGIEVRWVNKIQHNKFALFDGARSDISTAQTGVLASGSGNWSYGAATRFDENMVVIQGDARLLLGYQQEFNLLWDNSRPFAWNEGISPVPAMAITDELVAAATGSDAVFTSANFRVYESAQHGPTFAKVAGRSEVREALVDLIQSAEDSVWIASGHLRSRQITDAILAKAAQGVAIRVYLDGQEYTSAGYYGSEVNDFEDCLVEATTGGQTASCYNDGIHFGYALHEAGVDLRYKHYAYRWDYHYADQMHHKYLIVDESVVATGSYNFSNNAEFDTFENVSFLEAHRYPELVAGFVENFESIWTTGEGLYSERLAAVENGSGSIPLVYEPMALDWEQITTLKSAIRNACPDVNSDAFRSDPVAHQWCPRP